MLVTLIIGNCPECGSEAAFGNVNVSGNILLRGCFHCKYSERFYLPPLAKEVLYLDQFFLSHTFRAELPGFVNAARLIGELAHAQLIVCPFSTIQISFHQWGLCSLFTTPVKKVFDFILEFYQEFCEFFVLIQPENPYLLTERFLGYQIYFQKRLNDPGYRGM